MFKKIGKKKKCIPICVTLWNAILIPSHAEVSHLNSIFPWREMSMSNPKKMLKAEEGNLLHNQNWKSIISQLPKEANISPTGSQGGMGCFAKLQSDHGWRKPWARRHACMYGLTNYHSLNRDLVTNEYCCNAVQHLDRHMIGVHWQKERLKLCSGFAVYCHERQCSESFIVHPGKRISFQYFDTTQLFFLLFLFVLLRFPNCLQEIVNVSSQILNFNFWCGNPILLTAEMMQVTSSSKTELRN